MKSSKRSESEDRLSELPDALLVLILSLMETKDVIRTSVLSKRWKYLWTIIPYLKFEDYSDDCVRFQNIVNRTLLLRKGEKLLKFGVDFWYKPSAAGDVDLWLNIAMENEIEELCVNLVNELEAAEYTDTGYWTPKRLYSCSSIRKLSLIGCNLKIEGRVQWNRLKCLIISDVVLREHVMNQILLGTPQLEVLSLRLAESYENLNIRSSSLKKLFVDKYFRGYGDGHTVLTIWAPNVETLEITGFPFDEYVMMNVSSLTDATVCYEDPPFDNAARYSRYTLYGDILGQINYSVRRVAKLELPYWYQVTGVMRRKDMLAPLSDAKYLKLYVNTVDFRTVTGVLEICPKLSTLVLEACDESIEDWADTFEIHCDKREAFATENSFEYIMDSPESYLLHLTKVEIIIHFPEPSETDRFGSVFPAILFLLIYASKLETLVLHVRGRMSPESTFLIETILRMMPKSSPNVEVILR